jgi:hypothetical protein
VPHLSVAVVSLLLCVMDSRHHLPVSPPCAPRGAATALRDLVDAARPPPSAAASVAPPPVGSSLDRDSFFRRRCSPAGGTSAADVDRIPCSQSAPLHLL